MNVGVGWLIFGRHFAGVWDRIGGVGVLWKEIDWNRGGMGAQMRFVFPLILIGESYRKWRYSRHLVLLSVGFNYQWHYCAAVHPPPWILVYRFRLLAFRAFVPSLVTNPTPSCSCILQPALLPSRLQIAPILVERKVRLIRTIIKQFNSIQSRPGIRHSPKTEGHRI